jgi:hypothetical protein
MGLPFRSTNLNMELCTASTGQRVDEGQGYSSGDFPDTVWPFLLFASGGGAA